MSNDLANMAVFPLPAGVRPFTREDWYGFAGAEAEPATADSPALGPFILTAPQVSDVWMAILDRNGMEIYPDDTGRSYRIDLEEFNPEGVGGIREALYWLGVQTVAALAQMAVADLLGAGWIPCASAFDGNEGGAK